MPGTGFVKFSYTSNTLFYSFSYAALLLLFTIISHIFMLHTEDTLPSAETARPKLLTVGRCKLSQICVLYV